MSDVSFNENSFDSEEEISSAAESKEFEEETSSAAESDFESGDDYIENVQSEIRSENPSDYSANFANIENLFKFQIAIIIGFLLVVCFIIGWKHD